MQPPRCPRSAINSQRSPAAGPWPRPPLIRGSVSVALALCLGRGQAAMIGRVSGPTGRTGRREPKRTPTWHHCQRPSAVPSSGHAGACKICDGDETMTWSNLLSGLVGAGLGGLLAIAASIMTMRGQRSLALAATAEDKRQAQLRASYTASAQILGDMVTIKRGLDAMAASGLTLSSPLTPLYYAAVDAAERI